MDHLHIWEQVERTDPRHTKSFQRSGGFSGTAINAVYLARQATQVFGPMGIGWGVEIVDETIMQGAPMLHDGAVIGHELIHKLRINLWYLDNGQRGEVTHFGQTTFVGKNKYGPYTDEEAPKKSLTDATSKALSLLGFAADVHLGLYDDNKYVSDLRREFGQQPAGTNENSAAPLDRASDKQYSYIESLIRIVGWTDRQFNAYMQKRRYDWNALSPAHASNMIKDLERVRDGIPVNV